ncbi:helix-turn-helix domain-containing protein [Sessilibacter corallicola]|uniref:helix-turn-helix domain-containing protein n=1 Tax=Sessilibacter corallicola TaxID=2904075 RepID=UPI0033410BBB
MSKKQTTYSAVLGVVLSNARKQRNIEQGDMAKRMGLSQASYSRLESGKSSFSVDQMYMASMALGLPHNEITSRLNNTVKELRDGGIDVLPLMRGNATGNKDHTELGALVAGAALGALVFSLFSNK